MYSQKNTAFQELSYIDTFMLIFLDECQIALWGRSAAEKPTTVQVLSHVLMEIIPGRSTSLFFYSTSRIQASFSVTNEQFIYSTGPVSRFVTPFLFLWFITFMSTVSVFILRNILLTWAYTNVYKRNEGHASICLESRLN